MGNLSNTKVGNILPKFQKFLLEKKLAPEKNVFFYANSGDITLNSVGKRNIL